MNAEQILERAANVAADGVPSPMIALTEVARIACGDAHLNGRIPHACPIQEALLGAYMAVLKLTDSSLTSWYQSKKPTAAQTSQLFADALFAVQLGGAS